MHKRIVSLFTVFSLVLSMLMGAFPAQVAYAGETSAVLLDQEEIELLVGEEAILTAVVDSDDIANKEVSFTSSDETVAIVEGKVYHKDTTGINEITIKAVGKGEAIITATAADGVTSSACIVTVDELEPPVKEVGVFIDDFDDGNDNGWTTYAAEGGQNWSIRDNQYNIDVNCNGAKSIASNTNFADLIYEADIDVYQGINSDNAGLLFRVTDPQPNQGDGYKGYYVGIDKGQNKILLGRVNNGWKELGRESIDRTMGHLKVVAVGNHIQVYFNDMDNPVIDCIDDDGDEITTRGAIGIRTNWGKANIDNIYVREYSEDITDAPEFSIEEGVYSEEITVSITSDYDDAVIRYTTDGSMPSEKSPVYSGAITVSDNTVIRAYAHKEGAMASEIRTAQYIIASTADTSIDDFEDGNADGWTTYAGFDTHAWSVQDGKYVVSTPNGDKAVLQEDYTDFILETDINPYQSPDSSGVIFRVSDPGDGCDNMNGYFAGINTKGFIEIGKMNSEANNGSGNWTGIAKIIANVKKNQYNHLKVIGKRDKFSIYLNGEFVAVFTDSEYKDGMVGLRAWNSQGDIAFDNFKVTSLSPLMEKIKTPVISPNGGSFRDSENVTITCDTPDAEIYYTLDGTTPTENSNVYSGSILITETTTVKAIAKKSGMEESEIASATFTKLSDSFTEDFEDKNADGWITYEGSWSAATGAYVVNAGNGFKAIANGTNFANFIYEADVTMINPDSDTDNTGLIFRVKEPTNGADNLKGYYAGIKNDGFVQVGRFNNNWTELACIPYPITTGSTYRLKVEAKGKNIDVYVDGEHIVSVVDEMWTSGAIGVRTWQVGASYDNIVVTDTGAYTDPVYDWSWVKGAVFVPTNAVNEVQHWKFYDPEINDRELYYAHIYGLNAVRVYVHYLNWKEDKENFMANLEDFLTRADKYGIKTELVFFDDCWDDYPDWEKETKDLAPVYGVHNSRWLESPGDDIKALYNEDIEIRNSLKAYVQDIVNKYKDDDRILFWNIYNEPSNGESGLMNQVTKQIMNDARMWIKETGTKHPVSSTGGYFTGDPFSDFITWHPYEADYPTPYGVRKDILADECMNRGRDDNNQTVRGIVENYFKKGIGFVMWELGIGRDNTRFPWGDPLTSEPAAPFHGVVYPDGHPWDIDDIKALTEENFDNLPVFRVHYFKDMEFKTLAKTSITPMIDFDLGDEKGTGSPDPTAGIGEDNFSIRWAGTIQAENTGEYTFYVDSDNIARVWIGETQLIDKTSNQREEVSAKIALEGGKQYSVKVEYVHDTGDASMHLKWSGPGFDKTAVLPVYVNKAVTSISVEPTVLDLKVGESQKLTAYLEPMDASNQDVVWSSNKPGVASVDKTGMVTGLIEGTAIITVTTADGSHTATCEVTVSQGNTFRNPIVPVSGHAGSADPSVVFKDGYYYYCKSDNDSSIVVAKARRLQDIGSAPRVTVFTPPAGTEYSKEIWAPELQYIQGKWYIYFAADNGNNANHRMYVLESNTQDPQGTYTFKGKIAAPTDRWAIDGTVLETDDGDLYFVWSGWEGFENVSQNIYIAPMSNPWTISGERVMISKPDQPWERIGTPYINEGPEILKKDGKIFIVYSASGSWTDDYCLGMLTYSGGDILNPSSWIKAGPVFSKVPTAYGPGHNCFTVSPDGTEDWIVYHADKNSGGSWENRSIRAQKFTWNTDGTPNFGTPVAYDEEIQEPSGTPNVIRYKYEAEQAVHGGNVKVNAAGNASGGKVAGHIDTMGSDYVLFNIEAEKAGTYILSVMAANGSDGGAIAQHDVSVNGGESQLVTYKNYGWNHFNPSTIDVVLNEGNNTIKLSKRTNFAEIDYITLEAVENTGTPVPVEVVSMDKQNITVGKGKTAELTASIKPVSAIHNVVWTSSNPEVAVISINSTNSGVGTITFMVTGVVPGTATIKVESTEDQSKHAECTVTVLDDPTEPDISSFVVDSFEGETLDGAWSIFQETKEDWSLTKNPGALTIHTRATDVYQDNNSQNNVFLRTIDGSENFEIVTKITAPVRANHQQGGLFVWQDADNFVKLAHVWDNGKTIETAYEINQKYQKPGNFAPHPGEDTITLKIKKIGNVYTTYYWDGYDWIQAANSFTANLQNVKVGFFANNIVATNRIEAVFDYFAFRTIEGGVELDKHALKLKVNETAQLTNKSENAQEIVWSSSNPEVASVDATGLVKAVAPGRAIIKAMSLEEDFSDACVVTVTSLVAEPKVLFTEDFGDNNANGWSTYGGTWQVIDGQYMVDNGSGYKAVFDEQSFTDYVLEADVKVISGNEAGLIFRVKNPETGADAFDGYYLGINAAGKSAVLGHMKDKKWNEIAIRNLPIYHDQWYHLKVVVHEGHIQAYINDNPLNTNGYPKFDVLETSHLTTGKIGVRAHFANAMFDNIKVSSYEPEEISESYTNSVLPGIADPHVLYHEGTYYLYGTHTADWPNMINGIKVYTSKDLVNWTEHGWALHRDNSWGNKQFWAPEVIEKDGTFYMYYAVEEHLAVATSKSPLGPFVQEVKAPIHYDPKEIDAHVFMDDDGKMYFYFVRFTDGNVIYVAELNEDMKSIKEDTIKEVFRVSQDWEKSQRGTVGRVNEGPFVIKHKGVYYMTYSANHFESPDYGVGYATAPTPMGPWTKYEYNPIMKSNALVPGAGHHSLIYSPDGTELFMVYHTHNKVGTTEPRKLAIDRVHFVPQENGPDIMEVWGPTMTPQPMPSNKTEPEPEPVKNTDATLSSIKVNGAELPGFERSKYAYTVSLPAGTTKVPTVTVITSDAKATYIIQDANKLPGTTSIHVTAEDGVTKKVYTVNFTLKSDQGGDSGDNGSGGGGSGSSGGNAPVNKPEKPKVEGNQITLPNVKADTKGNLALEVSAQSLENAMNNSKDSTLRIKASIEGEAKEVSTSLPAKQLNVAKQKGIKTVDLDLGFATLSFEPDLFTQDKDDAKNLELSVAKVDISELPEEVRTIVGNAPVYDFNATVDGSKVSSFADGYVTISLDYPLADINDLHKVVVYYISDNGTLEIVKDVQYNEETGKIEFKVYHFSKYTVVNRNVYFSDIQRLDWAKESIEALAARNIIDGVGNNKFAPNEKVTRAQFIKMLMNALNLVNEDAKSNFTDVHKGTWYYSAVASAQELGIVNGKSDGSYGINDQITRQEMAAMAYRAAQAANIELKEIIGAMNFADQSEIASYAEEAIKAMQQVGVISGIGESRFAPGDNATRAQAAKIIYNLYNLQ
ncbi:family 43 glycosylhydrolase [Defluviitalea saccharophila]|uniref:Family 43 glycosylhydrolase n=1 Tax=Defluviitalea saccharophila TaxID=879970 RepID=A0ABZ2Y1K6_9FIRM